jgi:hypothetical protein
MQWHTSQLPVTLRAARQGCTARQQLSSANRERCSTIPGERLSIPPCNTLHARGISSFNAATKAGVWWPIHSCFSFLAYPNIAGEGVSVNPACIFCEDCSDLLRPSINGYCSTSSARNGFKDAEQIPLFAKTARIQETCEKFPSSDPQYQAKA